MSYLNTHEIFEHRWDIWTHMRYLNIHEIFEHTWYFWTHMRYLSIHEIFEHTWDIWTHMRHLNIHEIFEHTWDIWTQSVKTWTISFTFQHLALQLRILLANQWSILTKILAQEANCHPVRIVREQCAFKWRVQRSLIEIIDYLQTSQITRPVPIFYYFLVIVIDVWTCCPVLCTYRHKGDIKFSKKPIKGASSTIFVSHITFVSAI